MRALEPTRTGTVERDGATLTYDVYGDAGPTILLLPTWEYIYSRAWKLQIPFLAGRYRVVVYDATGTGRSTRPRRAERYGHTNRVADAMAVMDATDTASALAIGYSMGGELALYLSALYPERFPGIVSIGGSHPWRVPHPDRAESTWDGASGEEPRGWEKFNREYWARDWPAFTAFFMDQVNSDPHSTKGYDDCLGWGMEQDPQVLWWTIDGSGDFDADDMRRRLAASRVPTLLIHGTDDRITTHASSVVARDLIPGAELISVEGAGHPVHARYPVMVNLRILELAERVLGPGPTDTAPDAMAATVYASAPARRQKALYLSSPIGLGHARRDVAIADELVASHPDLQIDWLSQNPVTRVLRAAGHTVHPASALLASESGHIEAECGEHALDAFQAIRDMDEIMCHNFHVLDDVAAAGDYDLIIADESWELDYHLFENPGLKRAPLAWMTDFVGFLPMPAGGERQAVVAADYNLEMIEHVAKHPHLRDAAVFVGESDDIVAGTFGPGLPGIRDWTERNFDFAGYVTGFDPRALGDRERLRAQVGFGPRERVCVVSVGGSGVGLDLLRRVVAAVPTARRAVPELRVIVVTGPRIDPRLLPQVDGVEYHSYVDKLYRWLTACDLAIVQGGLTTTMELTAAKVPFIYVPLRDHFEQNLHVRARLDRYRAGRCMEYDQLDPQTLADAVVDLLSRDADFLDVNTDGAARAAAIIGALL
ncbi:alpha/beta fold hydrolase [Demequina aurantiaca]|uniref:alpha/beta fold hydrolase n=1 Tax=Demequina aurantiaca TaxID=676200 RepID=UPI003D33BE7E